MGRVDSNFASVASAMPSHARDNISNNSVHICVCICTYKRSQLLKRLLAELARQETGGLFSYSIVVSDNDQLRSAEAVVCDFTAVSSIPIKYCVEPQQNISRARNKAVENAKGDFIAFVDDDEFPADRWLLTLLKTCYEYGVDGVLGPVKRHFDEKPPNWLVKGGFYERPTHQTGFVMTWQEGRTGNLLIKTAILPAGEPPFRPEFRAGEDQDFLRRMIEKGHVFIWCNEAVVYEVVPPARWKPTYMLRKALLRGQTASLQPLEVLDIAKSVIAIPTYAACLPFIALLGRHRFVDLLVRLFDHLGKLLGLIGINPIKEPYVAG